MSAAGIETILPLQGLPGADDYVGKSLSGLCPACCTQTLFGPFGEDLRDGGFCAHCQASNRQRQVIMTLKALFGLAADLPTFLPDCRILLAEAATPLARALAASGCDLIRSEYFGPAHICGTLVEGVRHEDLMATSFADAALDMVISSDVFEHIPDAYAAFRETWRILKPGGRHIFTVPFYFHTLLDDLRSTQDAQGADIHLKPCVYHGDPIRPEGILVYRFFAVEMLITLERMGFAPRMIRLYRPDLGIVGSNALVFVAEKK